VALDLKISSNRQFLATIDSSVKNLDVSCMGLALKGDVGMKGAFSVNPEKPADVNYKIELNFLKPTLSGVYLLNEFSGLTGKIEISNNLIRTAGIQGYAYNTPVKFSGGIDLKQFELKLTSQARMDLANYRHFLPGKIKEKFAGMDFEGPAEVNIKFFDRLKDPQPVAIDGRIRLMGAALKAPAAPQKFKDISGEIIFKNDVFYISRLSFDYGAVEGCVLDAKIADLASPDVKMKLKNRDLSLDSRFRITKELVHILRLAGRCLNSSFNVSGDIRPPENPNTTVRGNIKLELADLRKLLPRAQDALTRFDLKGICELEALVSGPWKHPGSVGASLRGASAGISLWGLQLSQARIDLVMRDKHVYISELSARPYDGSLLATAEIDLSQPNPPYTANLVLEGLELRGLAADAGLKDKPVSGTALCKINCRGYGKNLETLRGEGLLFVKGGYLWEIPLLKGLANLLFMPNLSSIVFDEASANFAIANKAVSTSNLKFHSQNVGLLAEGSLFFDGGLDFLVTTRLSENFIKETSDFERIAGALLAETGQYMGRVKVGGSVKKPEYKFIPFPIDKILKDKFKELLGGFF
ncbi:MAG: hypothetical protein HY589_00215, partial [Candidatus Omnitrophica bacterium]|nr:hypothetical protein [Candidatus Omnitrophota bacterium]